MPTFNCAKYIVSAIDSVLAQSYRNYELIVVDDGSTDNTRLLLNSLITDRRIRYFYQDNKGLAVARNEAILKARGKYIACLDADDLWTETKLEIQTAHIARNPSIGMICTNAYKFIEDDLTTAVPILSDFPTPQSSSREMLDVLLKKFNPIIVTTVLIARRVLDDIGLYDPYLTRLGCEDRDLHIRILARYDAAYIPECLAYYRMRSQSMSKNFDRMFEARKYVLDKYLRSNIETSAILKRQAYSSVYLSHGASNYYASNYSKAIPSVLRAIAIYPFSADGIKMLIKCAMKWACGKVGLA